jgi:hypothetical protein
MKKKLEVTLQTALPSEPAVMGGADRGPIRLESPAITAADCTRTDAPPVAECWVGIDVAKAHLDVAIWPTRERLRVTHDEAGMAELIAGLRPRAVALIVLEATGGLETRVAGMLIEAQFPTAVINPRQARDFAKALGVLAKTDALDAGVLARFGQSIQPQPRPWKDEETQALTALLQRRRQLIAMLTAPRKIVWRVRIVRCKRISARRSLGWSNASALWMTTSTAASAPVRCGASKTICCRAFLELAP